MQQGVDYLLVRNETDFITALRTHRYGTIVLGELQLPAHGGDGEDDSSLRLSDSAADEMEASVIGGTGLVWIKASPDEEDDVLPLFGAKPIGVISNLSQVVLPNSVASSAGSWTTHGYGLKLKLMGGTNVGSLVPGQLPAMVVSQYGDGRTALMAFDPSAFNDPQAGMTVLDNVLSYAESSSTDAFPGGIMQLTWTASALVAPIDVELKAHLPAGWSIVAAPGGTISSPTDAVWDQHVTSDSYVFSGLVKVPFTKGTSSVSAVLYQNQSGTLTQLAQNSFNLTLSVSRDDLGAQALN
jgi:hypothetical protein